MDRKLSIRYDYNYVIKQEEKDRMGKLHNTNIGYLEAMGIQVMRFFSPLQFLIFHRDHIIN